MTEFDSTDTNEAPQRLPYSALAITSFALGVAGLLLFAVPALPWLFSILAVVLGHTGRREIKQGEKQGWGYDIGGLVLGYLVLATLLIGAFAQR